MQKACHERISGEKMTATTTHFASNIVRRRDDEVEELDQDVRNPGHLSCLKPY